MTKVERFLCAIYALRWDVKKNKLVRIRFSPTFLAWMLIVAVAGAIYGAIEAIQYWEDNY